MALSFISSIFIARIGGAAIFGNISLATSFQALIKSIFSHSVNNAHLKVYNDDTSVGVKNYLLLNLFFNLLTSLLIVVFVLWNSRSSNNTFSQVQLHLIIIFIIQDYLLTPLTIYTTDQYAKLNVKRGNFLDFSSQVLTNLAKIAAVLLGQTEIGIAWAIIIACCISSVFPIISLSKGNIGKYSFQVIKKYIRLCLYISTSALAYGLLLSFDKILLGFFAVSPEKIGYYNAGNRLGILLMSLGVSVGGIFLSVFSKNIAEKNQEKTLEQLKQYERYISIFFIPVILVPIFFGEELLMFIYGKEFTTGYIVLVFALIVAYLKTTTIPYQNYLFANNSFKVFNRLSIVFAVVIVASTFLFAFFDLFPDKTTSVAFGLLFSCIVDRILFGIACSRIDKEIKMYFYPQILLFFVLIAVGWFSVRGLVSGNILISYIIRVFVLLLIIPVGYLLKIYKQEDYRLITQLAGAKK